MSIETLKDQLPDYAKDLRLNISNLTSVTSMNQQQLWGTLLSSALATGNATVIRAIEAEAREKLSDEAMNAAKSAASIMAMNNIYYRFVHLSEKEDYLQMPARLRMNVIGNPGVEKADFELWSLAVSAINGCGMCIQAHEKTLVKDGVSKEAIQDSARLAAILSAIADTLTAEQALSSNGETAAAA